VRAQLRAEFLKQRSTRTSIGLFAAMLALVLLAVLLHAFALAPEDVDSRSEQLTNVFGWGEVFGALFAGLLGGMSITSEIRHGTIRPTFLVTPRRGRVVAAKAIASMLTGFGFGLIAATVAAGAGSIALSARGMETHLDVGDYALLLAGSAAATALWAAIGLGVGAVVRNQVATTIALIVWLLFVDNQLAANVAGLGRFAPGALGQALSGQDPDTLLAPALGALLLALYAVAAAAGGWFATARRDVV
jgi:ABC-type transport system involved in multi-copper enzyme maturation permease subunit